MQTQQAAGASQQRERMFGMEEHFHIVQRVAAEEEVPPALWFSSATYRCSVQHPFQLQCLKLGMHLGEEQQPTTQHRNVSSRLGSHCQLREQWFYAELVFDFTKINAKFYLVKTVRPEFLIKTGSWIPRTYVQFTVWARHFYRILKISCCVCFLKVGVTFWRYLSL